MSGLVFGGVFGAVDDPLLRGLTALQPVVVAGETVLAGLGRNGASTFRIEADGTLTLVQQYSFGGAFLPGVSPSLVPLSLAGMAVHAVAGQFPGGVAFVTIGAGGSIAPTAAPGGWPASAALVTSVEIAGAAHAVTWDPFAQALRLHSLASPTAPAVAELTGVSGLRALATATVGGTSFTVTADAGGALTVHLIADGAILLTDRVNATDALTLSAVSQIVSLRLGSETYVLVAAAGSSSLSALRLAGDGSLTVTDHVIDALGSRFQSVKALAVASSGDRAYVLAGGADDGVSAFLLLPGGRFHHLGSFEDTTFASLQNVSGLTAYVQGGSLTVIASGEVEGGLTRLTIDLSDDGITRVAGSTGTALSGGAGDDILLGGAGADTLSGGGGDDLLIDGAGTDLLTGGAGADIFILDLDGATDRITDFDVAWDRIDLSRIPMLYDLAEVAIVTTAMGAELRYRGEVLILQSVTGGSLTAAAVRPALIVSVDRPPLLAADPQPTNGNDTLIGGEGRDTIWGLAGDDLIEGGDGDDILWGDGPPDEDLLARIRSSWPDGFGEPDPF
jgi:Ca2+-binding RTX toxin-like protein